MITTVSNQILAEVITIGDEILFGQITNTNTKFISESLTAVGIKTIRHTSVSDSESEILNALAEAHQRASIIMITGGLGPTKDDITKKTLAKYFDSALEMNTKALEDLSAFFSKRGRAINDLNKLQALQPLKSTYIQNKVGTAPGMWFMQDGRVYVSMPGVPFEMQTMVTTQIIPKLLETFKPPIIIHRFIKTVGIPESDLAIKIETWEDNLPDYIGLAYLPNYGQVKLRLTAQGDNKETLDTALESQIELLRPLIKDYIFSESDLDLEGIVANLLTTSNLTLSVAESCTGGALGTTFTAMPGASKYFEGGFVTYSDKQKINLLGVNPTTIKAHSVYSTQVASEMAKGVAKAFGTDIGLATTGVAGPDDDAATGIKAGTMFIGIYYKGIAESRKLDIYNNRQLNIKLTINTILNDLRKRLLSA